MQTLDVSPFEREGPCEDLVNECELAFVNRKTGAAVVLLFSYATRTFSAEYLDETQPTGSRLRKLDAQMVEQLRQKLSDEDHAAIMRLALSKTGNVSG